MKKKLLIVVLSLICVFACAFGLAACAQKDETTTHTHDYKWVDNGNGTHSGHCSIDGCDKPDVNNETHAWGANNKCEKCPAVKPANGHIHSWSQSWSTSSTHHWHDCTANDCTVIDNAQKDGYSEHDFSNGNCVCGKVRPTDSHSHAWSQSWSTSSTHHWHDCTANDCAVIDNAQKDGYSEHDFSNGNCVCGKVKPSTTPEHTQHSFGTWTSDGKTTHTHTCACGESETQSHTWNSGTVTTSATCADFGVKTYTCSICSETKMEQIAKLTTHTYGTWEVEIQPTEQTEGQDKRLCIICGNIDRRSIPALPHTHVWNTSEFEKDETYHWYACNGCSEKKDKVIHEFTSGYCTCGEKETSKGLQYTFNGNGYTLIGIGMCTDMKIVIPERYNGKPITEIGDYAFENFKYLSGIEIPSSVTKIGNSAFKGCAPFTDIEIPDSVTDIGDNAFYGCTTLTDIIIGENVLNIGHYAFYNCSSLENIEIGNNLISIGYWAFGNCSSLTDISLGNSIDSIGNYAFSNCSKLKSIIISDSITHVGLYAFNNCSSLSYKTYSGARYLGNKNNPYVILINITNSSSTSCTIHANTKVIYGRAFYGCTALTGVTLPNSIKSIEDYAFYGCKKITKILFGENLLRIGENAFCGCDIYNNVVVPNSVTYIGKSAFRGNARIKNITIPFVGESKTNNKYFGYIFGASSYNDNASSVPASLQTVTITGDSAISQWAFYGCDNLSSITIPFVGEQKDGVNNSHFGYIFGASSYRDNASYVPASLKTVIITGSSVIRDDAFNGCSSLTNITIPNSLTHIGWDVFYNCNNLLYKEYNNALYLGNSENPYLALIEAKSTSIVSCTIHADTKIIVDDAFSNCINLRSITVDANNANYTSDNGILYNSTRTEIIRVPQTVNGTITIPSSVTNIRGLAFSGCSSLTSIKIPDGVTNIGDAAFRNCSSLTNIEIPNSLTNIGWSAFSGCNSIKSITFIGNIKAWCEIDGLYELMRYGATDKALFINGEHIAGAIVIPSSVTKISNGAFYNCSSLTNIEISNSIESIGNYAFYNCSSLTSVTIGNDISSIGWDAFYGCSSITNIEIPNSVVSIGDDAFRGCSSLTIYCVATEMPSGWSSDWNYSSCPVVLDCKNNNKDENGYEYSIIDGIRYSLKDGIANVVRQPIKEIETIIIPSSVMYKGISYNVTSIGDYAFYNYGSLTSIEIPNSVTNIGGYAFYNCCSLTSIEIPNGVTNIGDYAFRDCSSLTIYCVMAEKPSRSYYWNYSSCPIVLDCKNNSKDENGYEYSIIDGIRYSLKDGIANVVRQSKNITEVITIPSSVMYNGISYSVTSIEEKAFFNCSKLTAITIPNCITSIGGNAFQGCSNLQYNKYDNGLYLGNSTNQYFALVLAKNTDIASCNIHADTLIVACRTFNDCKSLTSITIPDSVIIIGLGAFSGCNKLTSITLTFVGESKDGAGHTHFGYIFGANSYSDSASYVPSSLKTVVITGGTSIVENAFYNCRSLESITIPNNVTQIARNAFSKCSGLTSISIPSSVTSIGLGAFAECSQLASITIPFVGESKSYNMYLGYIFGANTYNDNATCVPFRLKTVVITGGTSIAAEAFYNCNSITSITLPSSIMNIGYAAFWGCSNLTSITIPSRVTSIGGSVLRGCSSLTSITVETGNTAYRSVGNCLIEISGKRLLAGCKNSVIPSDGSVTSIANEAFYGCSGLKSVTIPNSVKSFGNHAFDGCSGLTSITYYGTIAQWNSITKYTWWNDNTGNYTVHCTDGDISKSNS